MAYPDFSTIAKRTGIPRCRGIRLNGQLCHDFNHNGGAIGDGLVHWADRRRIERAAIRRFLTLGALLELESTEPRSWARLYLAQRRINDWAKDIGVTFPSTLSANDRLKVKAMLINVPTDEPLRMEAMRWAQDG
jgi:hypothetical protein